MFLKRFASYIEKKYNLFSVGQLALSYDINGFNATVNSVLEMEIEPPANTLRKLRNAIDKNQLKSDVDSLIDELKVLYDKYTIICRAIEEIENATNIPIKNKPSTRVDTVGASQRKPNEYTHLTVNSKYIIPKTVEIIVDMRNNLEQSISYLTSNDYASFKKQFKDFYEPKLKTRIDALNKIQKSIDDFDDLYVPAIQPERSGTSHAWDLGGGNYTSINFPTKRELGSYFSRINLPSEKVELPKDEDYKMWRELYGKISERFMGDFRSLIENEKIFDASKKSQELKDKLYLYLDNFNSEMISSETLYDLIKIIHSNVIRINREFLKPEIYKNYDLQKILPKLSEVIDAFCEEVRDETNRYAEKLKLVTEDEKIANKLFEISVGITNEFKDKIYAVLTVNDRKPDTESWIKFYNITDKFYKALKESDSGAKSMIFVRGFIESFKRTVYRIFGKTDNKTFAEIQKLFSRYREKMERETKQATHYNADNDGEYVRGKIITTDKDYIDAFDTDEFLYGNQNKSNISTKNKNKRKNQGKENPLSITDEEFNRYKNIKHPIQYTKEDFIGMLLKEGTAYRNYMPDNFSHEMVPVIQFALDPEKKYQGENRETLDREAREAYRYGSGENKIYKPTGNGYVLQTQNYPGINDIINRLMIENGMEYGLRYTKKEWEEIIPKAISEMRENYSDIQRAFQEKFENRLQNLQNQKIDGELEREQRKKEDAEKLKMILDKSK